MAQASDPIASSSADTSGFGNLPPLNRGDRNLNPPGIRFLALLREDLQTFDGNLFRTRFLGNRSSSFRQLADGHSAEAAQGALQFGPPDADMVGRTD